MNISQGIWTIGRVPGTIVSDCEDVSMSADAREYFGGSLIALSIVNKADLALMANAKEIFEASREVVDWLASLTIDCDALRALRLIISKIEIANALTEDGVVDGEFTITDYPKEQTR